jgi:hypothetical protein
LAPIIRASDSHQPPDLGKIAPPMKQWSTTMLAEIFMLRLEAMLRMLNEQALARSDGARFVPIKLPGDNRPTG